MGASRIDGAWQFWDLLKDDLCGPFDGESLSQFFWPFYFLPPTLICLENRDKASAFQEMQEIHIQQSLGIWSLYPLGHDLLLWCPSPETIHLIGLAKSVLMEIPEQTFEQSNTFFRRWKDPMKWGRVSENQSILQASFHQPSTIVSVILHFPKFLRFLFALIWWWRTPKHLRIQLSIDSLSQFLYPSDFLSFANFC